MKLQFIRVISIASLLFVSTAPSFVRATTPLPILDDNGNASFVRQVLPKLLGRKPKGTLEVNLLKDIIELHGREAVVRLLMEQDEFVSHWMAILIDHMKVQRADKLNKNRPQSAECFEEGVDISALQNGNQVPAQASELAQFVRDEPSYTPYDKDFNMHDLVKSSLHLDDLFPAYRGYLYVLASRHNTVSSMRTEAEARAEVGEAFDDVFLNRNMQCISCHRGTYSTTGIGDRTHPLYESLDNAVFDHSGQSELPDITHNAYITQCASCHGAKGTGNPAIPAPGILGFTKEQFENAVADAIQNGGLMATVTVSPAEDTIAATTNSNNNGIESIVDALKDKSVFALENISDTTEKHYAALRRDFFAYEEPDAGEGPWNMNTSCASILDNVSEPIPAFFASINSQTATVKDIDEQLQFGYQDLSLSITIPLMPSLDPSNLIPGRTAVAYMLAAKITDNVWEQIFGERLTIVNQFARNSWQKEMHKHLTEDVFIANDWSLKELLVEILGSRFFNRNAPISSMASGPYKLHPIFDPFVPPDQTCLYEEYDSSSSDNQTRGNIVIEHTPNENCAFNSQGELVHRYSPRTLLSSIGHALNWPAPKIFPGNNYPSEQFSASIGQYTSEFDPGDKNVGFQVLLNWDSQYGTCNPDDEIEGNDNVNNNDWLDHLIGNIDEFNELNPGSPLTLGELVLTLKDWLIQEPVFAGYEPYSTGLYVADSELTVFDTNPDSKESDPLTAMKDIDFSEEQLVYGLFGTSLEDYVSSETANEGKLRDLCGVYLKAPQFMLASLVRNDVFEAPRYRVCNDDNCSYYSMCSTYKSTLSKLELPIACGLDSVSIPDVKTFPQKIVTTGDDNDGDDTATLCVKC